MVGKVFYKYRDISDRTENILRNKKIWLAKPSTLNDPYECMISEFTQKERLNEITQSMGNQLMGFIMTFKSSMKKGESVFGLSYKEMKRVLKRIEKVDKLEEKYKIANYIMKNKAGKSFSSPSSIIDSVDEILDNAGVFSLSEDPLNKLMWSHYSLSHKGLALGFEFESNSILKNEEYFKPMNYNDEPLSFDLDNGRLVKHDYFYNENMQLDSKMSLQFKDSQLQQVFFTKTTEWAYEKEWRYIREKFGEYDFPTKLSQIVFGLNCSLENINKITQLCNECYDYKLNYFQVQRVDKSVDLRLEQLDF